LEKNTPIHTLAALPGLASRTAHVGSIRDALEQKLQDRKIDVLSIAVVSSG
jgi:hypothetical protein